MKLFYSTFHDFAHKAVIAVHEAGLQDDVTIVPTFPFLNMQGELVSGQYDISELNPFGKVPMLTLDDGTALYQSQVVVEYLDSVSKANKLYPAVGTAERIDAVQRLSIGDGIFEFAVHLVMEDWNDENERRVDLYTWLWPKITRAFDLLESKCSEWEGFDIGHAGLIQGITFLDATRYGNETKIENPCVNWRENWPKLYDWMAETVKRPSIQSHYKKAYEGDASPEFHRKNVEEVLSARKG